MSGEKVLLDLFLKEMGKVAREKEVLVDSIKKEMELGGIADSGRYLDAHEDVQSGIIPLLKFLMDQLYQLMNPLAILKRVSMVVENEYRKEEEA